MDLLSLLPTGIIAYAALDCNIPIKIFLFANADYQKKSGKAEEI